MVARNITVDILLSAAGPGCPVVVAYFSSLEGALHFCWEDANET
jgi:hypothetical protein